MSSETQTVVPAPANPSPPATTQASLVARLGAEAFGTFALVLAIVGVALYGRIGNAGLVLPVALAGGLILVALVASIGHVSGGHYNPAVTLGLTIAGRARWVDLLPYWVAQVVGAVLAAGALFVTMPRHLEGLLGLASKNEMFGATANTFGTHTYLHSIWQSNVAQGATLGEVDVTLLQAVLVEALVTAVFVGVVIAATDKRTKGSLLAPLSIGVALFVSISVAAPLTNGSVNPARSTASAVFSPGGVSGIFLGHQVAGQLWVFWVGPLVGAFVAALFFLAFAAPAPASTTAGTDELAEADADEAAPVEVLAVEEEGSAAVVLDKATTDAAATTADPIDTADATADPIDTADATADAADGDGDGDEQGPAPR